MERCEREPLLRGPRISPCTRPLTPARHMRKQVLRGGTQCGHSAVRLICFRPVWVPVLALPLRSSKALVQHLPDSLSCPWPPRPRCVGNRVPGRSVRACGPAGGVVTGPLGQGPGGRPGIAWLETLGRQDLFCPPHLPGAVSPASLGEAHRKPLEEETRAEARGVAFPWAGPHSLYYPGPLFTQLSLGTES